MLIIKTKYNMRLVKKGLFAVLAMASLSVNAQSNTSSETTSSEVPAYKNAVKINLIPLVTRTISLEYERAVADKITLNATIAITPKGDLPFKSQFEDNFDDINIINATKFGAFSAALEGRFYLGRKGAMRGFYIAPFAKYSDYNVKTSISFVESSTNVTEYVPISGGISTMTFGFSLGVQWQLAKRITLDWRIIGPNYGFSSGTLEGKKELSAEDQKTVLSHMNDFNDIPLMKFKNEVNSQGAKSTISGPWAGIRTGLSIGFKL